MWTQNGNAYGRLVSCFVVAVGVGLGGLALASDSPEYSVVDLGTLGGPDVTTFPGSGGADINDSGDVTGFSVASDTERNVRGFLWSNDVLIELLATPGNIHSQGLAMNNSGTIVGTSYDMGALVPNAMRWNGAKTETIGQFVAIDINDGGVVVGERVVPPSLIHNIAVRWDAGRMIDLGTLGGTSSGAYGINEAGQIVGLSFLSADALFHAFLWNDGVMTDLGTLGGQRSHAYDINEHGQIVGFAENASGSPHGFLFEIDESGAVATRTDLGELGGGFSYAFALNDDGVVVGSSDSKAFVWSDGELRDLNDLIPIDTGWTLTHAMGINNDGAIVGLGRHLGHPRAFLLKPVLAGDLDGNGIVDAVDLLSLLAQWGPCEDPCPPVCGADLNEDCTVDVADLLILIADWG